MIKPSGLNKEEIYNGRYLLIQSTTTIFLPDEAILGFSPVSPQLLMICGNMIDIDWRKRSKSFITDLFNAFTFQKSTTRIIVREGTSIQDIGKLKRNQFAKKAKKYIKLFTSDKTKEVDLKILKSLGRNKHL